MTQHQKVSPQEKNHQNTYENITSNPLNPNTITLYQERLKKKTVNNPLEKQDNVNQAYQKIV